MSFAVRGNAWIVFATALIGLLVVVAVKTWDVKAVIASVAQEAGAVAGEAAAAKRIAPVEKTLADMKLEARVSDDRAQYAFCMEYKHSELPVGPRKQMCEVESEGLWDWWACGDRENPEEDCGTDPRRQK